uniref:Hint domain-containing protein n=1 Tax=Tetradesmus obliquus TaxID=3088 RepID=A0A383WKW5_TETOB|eukprot:jgi/Sobl393_1/8729/SZX78110.1
MARTTTSPLAVLLCVAVAFCLAAEVASLTIPCKKELNGLYPDLDNLNFNTFASCVAGKVVGATRTCPKGRRFSFMWQRCIPKKFLVAFDERKLAGAARSADGSIQAVTCVESGPEDGDDAGVYYKTCGPIKAKGICDKGQKWMAGAGCVDSLGADSGNAYEGYKRLPDLDFKANLVTCDIVDTIIKAVEKAPSTKFVMKLKDDKSRSSEFAFEVLARDRGGVTTGLTKTAYLSIAAETNIKSLDVEGDTMPGFYLGYIMRPQATLPDGDVLGNKNCKFVVTEPAMMRRMKKLDIQLPSSALSPVVPAAVTPEGCTATGVVTGLTCAGGAFCTWWTAGACAAGAVALCAAGVLSTANCIDSNSGGGCFPAGAMLQLPGGISKRMDQLVLGDKLQTMSAAGATTYSDVYLFGHDDPHSYERFVALQLSTNKLLLTHGHYIPTATGPACSIANPAACTRLMKRAADVQLGDLVWSVNATSVQFGLDVVKDKSEEVHRGLYNPFTLSGDLVVNGVLASAHSDWFLDPVMPQSHVSHIPAIYQTVMAPMRAAYYVGGPNAVKYLDANLKVVEMASKMSL